MRLHEWRKRKLCSNWVALLIFGEGNLKVQRASTPPPKKTWMPTIKIYALLFPLCCDSVNYYFKPVKRHRGSSGGGHDERVLGGLFEASKTLQSPRHTSERCKRSHDLNCTIKHQLKVRLSKFYSGIVHPTTVNLY